MVDFFRKVFQFANNHPLNHHQVRYHALTMGTEAEERKDVGEKDKPQPLPRILKVLTTMAIFWGNITFGCAMTAYSPSLTDFVNKFDTDTSTISIVFSIITGCYSAGALCCTIIYRLMNRQFTVSLLFMVIAACMFVSPHLPNLTLFYVTGGILGFCMGCYDTAQVVWILEMHQADSGPFVQAQHFCYAIGSIIAPVLMSPFLTEEDKDDDDSITTTTAKNKEENSRLFVPFTIIGCLCAVTALVQMLLFLLLRYRPPPAEFEDEGIDDKKNDAEAVTSSQGNGLIGWVRQQWPGWKVARLVILAILVVGFDQGMEMCTIALFPTFGQKSDLKLSESAAADTLTGLSVAFTVARGASIFLVFKIPPILLLAGNLVLVAIGNILLVIWGNKTKGMIWAAGILYGLGFSSMMPSFCAYMERYVQFTNTVGALMIVCGSFVGSMYPLIVGNFMDDHPLVITYPIFFSLAVMTAGSGIAYSILRKSKNRAGE